MSSKSIYKVHAQDARLRYGEVVIYDAAIRTVFYRIYDLIISNVPEEQVITHKGLEQYDEAERQNIFAD